MSELDKLIKKYCPNGVEYKELNDVVISLNTGLNPRNFFKLNTEDAENYYVTIREMCNGKIRFTDKTDRINEEAINLCNNRSNLEEGDVLFSGTGTIGETVVICETPYNWNIKEGIYSIKPNQSYIISSFLSYLLVSSEIKKSYLKKVAGGTVKSIPMVELKKIKIPVPPLEVQREIVRILDSFTLLTAELTAELTARKKQYEYYRNELLSNKIELCSSSKLSDIAEIYDGTHQTPEYKTQGIPFISVENINDIYSSSKYISVDAYNKYRVKPMAGDVFMTRIGSIGKCAIMTKDEDLAYYVSLALIRPNRNILDSRYLRHYIESSLGTKELSKRTLHNAVPIKINKDDIGKIIVKYPKLELQIKIANVLDNFDAICSDLNIGLPAEIEARKKQYEYYRDLLLTFAETGNIIATDSGQRTADSGQRTADSGQR